MDCSRDQRVPCSVPLLAHVALVLVGAPPLLVRVVLPGLLAVRLWAVPMKYLNDLGEAAYETAKAKGWHEEELHVPTKLALIHSEVSEALECFRNNEPDTVGPDGKPEGVASELADVIIRTVGLAVAMGIDIDAAVELKMDFNRTRPYKHGGKTC